MSLTRADFECLIDYLKKDSQHWKVKAVIELYEENKLMREELKDLIRKMNHEHIVAEIAMKEAAAYREVLTFLSEMCNVDRATIVLSDWPKE